MDHPHFTSLMAFLKGVPDSRKPRGQRYAWWFLLAIICGGILSGHLSGRAIAQWAALHAVEIMDYLQISLARMPSESTVRRALHQVDIEELERQIGAFGVQADCEQSERGRVQGRDGEVIRGLAVDGKAVRGANTHGAQVYLVSCVGHESGITLRQSKVEEKTNEIRAVPELLAGQDLRGTVVTFDALLAQQNLAQQVVDQHGHYLMVIKRNQPTLCADIETLFNSPLPPRDQDTYTTTSKGHGRLEKHTLTCSVDLQQYLDWPGARQVLRRRRECLYVKQGRRSDELTYGLTSLGADQARARELETIWRRHWTIENRSHYVRDETLKEDRCQMRVGNAPQAFAALKNGLLTLLRTHGWSNIADALRYYDASVQETLHLLGIERL